MPPSVVRGTVPLALSAQSQPLPPRPSPLSPKGAVLRFRDARAPHASTVPEPTGWQTAVQCAGHSFAQQRGSAATADTLIPRWSVPVPSSPSPKRARRDAAALLPAMRRAAPSAMPEPGARASAGCGGGAAAGWHSG